ncbi:helix-turn-helix domain-containing protein [Subtercola frigoramans]|uniref:Transcriptional regulator with XRE-family HTH domain n=2 Tax=Actinomycetes TaxID=1760 RepID=A0ABS2L700_9MICO|nr:helix-turn-helix transcriptional regulator [Subtercola frigoramans]MBM7472505.1 transcriptional regulator with XRE-family HTH domain [Subtercola frigoramans]
MRNAETAQHLGEYLQKARHTTGLTIRQLSELSGVPRTTIGKIERGGTARPRPDLLTAVGTALNVPIADLYALANYPAPHNLPSFAPYLRARYHDLSPSTVEELEHYFVKLAQRDGVSLTGPQNGEDEKH